MISSQKDLVAAIKADVLARGVLRVPQQTNCDAFAITGRVAWALRFQGAKLIIKHAPQNGCYPNGPTQSGYSHDSIRFPDGNADCLVNGGPPSNANVPAWQWTPAGPPNADEVAEPFDLDAAVVVAPPPTPQPPTPGPVDTFPPESDLPTVWSTAEYGTFEWFADMGRNLSLGYHILLHRPKANPTDFLGALNWLKHIVIDKRDPAWVWAAFRNEPEYKARHS